MTVSLASKKDSLRSARRGEGLRSRLAVKALIREEEKRRLAASLTEEETNPFFYIF